MILPEIIRKYTYIVLSKVRVRESIKLPEVSYESTSVRTKIQYCRATTTNVVEPT